MTAEDGSLRSVVVLGGGSAGLLAALALKQRRPALAVTVVRSSAMGVIGVGESTTPLVPITLHVLLGIDPAAFHRAVLPSYKLGIRFLWGQHPRFHFTFTPQFDRRDPALPRPKGFYCDEACDYADLTAALMARDRAFEPDAAGRPRLGGHLAYHLENRRLVGFLEAEAERRGVGLLDRTVAGVETGPAGVSALALEGGGRLAADLFVDCSGFRARLLGEALEEPFLSYAGSLFCDRAVVGEWPRGADEPVKPFTTAETMAAGWAWRIEHPDLVSLGYVHASAFLSADAAEAELRAANPRLGEARLIRFRSGRFARSWVGNVVAIGNAAGFVEPLESTALGVICDAVVRLAGALEAAGWRAPGPPLREAYNRHHAFMWDSIRRFLAIHFRFNGRLDTAFWRACRAEVALAGGEAVVDYYREAGPALPWPQLRQACEPFGVEGWLALLLGQGVDYRGRGAPDPTERAQWATCRARLWERAGEGLTIEQGLAAIADEGFVWRPEMFANAAIAR